MASKAVAQWIKEYRYYLSFDSVCIIPATEDQKIEDFASKLVEDQRCDSSSDVEAAEKALIKYIRMLRISSGGGEERCDLTQQVKKYLSSRM